MWFQFQVLKINLCVMLYALFMYISVFKIGVQPDSLIWIIGFIEFRYTCWNSKTFPFFNNNQWLYWRQKAFIWGQKTRLALTIQKFPVVKCVNCLQLYHGQSHSVYNYINCLKGSILVYNTVVISTSPRTDFLKNTFCSFKDVWFIFESYIMTCFLSLVFVFNCPLLI